MIDNIVTQWITAHAYLVLAFTLIMGALFHYSQDLRKGNITSGFWDYWLFDNKVHSAGAVGALVAAWTAAVTGDILHGASWALILESGWAGGYMLNSVINKGDYNPPKA